MSVDVFLKAVRGLPEVTEADSFGGMTGFRVHGKGFCYLNEADGIILLKATREEQEALVAEAPEVFSPSWSSGRFAWLEIDLGKVDPEELGELVTEGWRLSAPKRLADTLPAPSAP
ncbi:MmcQ/YjbR family DNA-binding protein [Actinomadura formosensis]|uniref:MmcQ/YjbR family DNA-binding protein n=1 Tax=Actinomadura formosensis TaxID=60706 RepID=UPI00083485CD|nr:MmcQ/YjbR family DNA-binding protein [Actinomadura formosensis]